MNDFAQQPNQDQGGVPDTLRVLQEVSVTETSFLHLTNGQNVFVGAGVVIGFSPIMRPFNSV